MYGIYGSFDIPQSNYRSVCIFTAGTVSQFQAMKIWELTRITHQPDTILKSGIILCILLVFTSRHASKRPVAIVLLCVFFWWASRRFSQQIHALTGTRSRHLTMSHCWFGSPSPNSRQSNTAETLRQVNTTGSAGFTRELPLPDLFNTDEPLYSYCTAKSARGTQKPFCPKVWPCRQRLYNTADEGLVPWPPPSQTPDTSSNDDAALIISSDESGEAVWPLLPDSSTRHSKLSTRRLMPGGGVVLLQLSKPPTTL